MKTKIERYTDKFIDTNFDKKDKKKEPRYFKLGSFYFITIAKPQQKLC